MCGLERESIRRRFVGETDAERALQQRSKRVADRQILVVALHDARILQRVEQAARAQRETAVADAAPRRLPEPLGADVVAVEKGRLECAGIDDETVPLREQQMRRGSVGQQLLQHERRIVGARLDRRDGRDLDPGGDRDSRRHCICQEQRSAEVYLRLAACERAQRQRVVGRVDNEQRDRRQIEHRDYAGDGSAAPAAARSRTNQA